MTAIASPIEYQLIGLTEDGGAGDLLTGLDQKHGRIRLLDQVTILSSGEAIVFGSAFHIPTRVQFDRPDPGPYSQTAAPYHEWSKEKDAFPLAQVIAAWGA